MKKKRKTEILNLNKNLDFFTKEEIKVICVFKAQ